MEGSSDLVCLAILLSSSSKPSVEQSGKKEKVSPRELITGDGNLLMKVDDRELTVGRGGVTGPKNDGD